MTGRWGKLCIKDKWLEEIWSREESVEIPRLQQQQQCCIECEGHADQGPVVVA